MARRYLDGSRSCISQLSTLVEASNFKRVKASTKWTNGRRWLDEVPVE